MRVPQGPFRIRKFSKKHRLETEPAKALCHNAAQNTKTSCSNPNLPSEKTHPGIPDFRAHLFGFAVRLVERLAKALHPARARKRLLKQVLRRADAVGVVKGQVEALFVEQRADVLAGDRSGNRQPLVAELGCVL